MKFNFHENKPLTAGMLINGFNMRGDRQKDDFYATPFEATEQLLNVEKFDGKIYEPCCGQGHISKVLEKKGYEVESSDLVDRGFGKSNIDFLMEYKKRDNIITNPPYGRLLMQFVNQTQNIAQNKIALLLKLTFLEGQERKKFFKIHPPTRVHVFSKRLALMKNGESYDGGMMALAWFVWDKKSTKLTTINWL
tara:strand:- start:373 stop:951 length:579 start_codon:yes stop_codon:yes gene_type:complete